MAVVLGLLLMLALGAFEYGVAFRDWLTVSAATREGARMAAAAGPLAEADCRTLEATAGSLQNLDGDAVAEVWVYRSNASGAVLGANRYRPKVDTDSPGSLVCNQGWYPIGSPGYPWATRDNEGASRHWIGVRVLFDHTWRTDFLWWSGSVRWSDNTVMRIEPAT
jgi:hypothetical protein